MIIRNARAEDAPAIHRLAASLGLDYKGLETDRVWVAEDEGRIAGLVALKKHADCEELVSLGVEPSFRSSGAGGRLIEALMAESGGPVHLATIIPAYFERHGFVRIFRIPTGMAKDPSWCVGCEKDLCTIMVRTNP